MIDLYPNIKKACFLITLDNGGLNRDRSEEKVYADMDAWITELSANEHNWHFQEVDNFLGTLDEVDFDDCCTGEESDMEAIQARGPDAVGELLNKWFEGPC